MTFKEKMAMFNKKKDFKVETPYDAIRRERAERKAAKAAAKAAKAAAAKGAAGGGGSSLADAAVRAASDQRRADEHAKKEAAVSFGVVDKCSRSPFCQ